MILHKCKTHVPSLTYIKPLKNTSLTLGSVFLVKMYYVGTSLPKIHAKRICSRVLHQDQPRLYDHVQGVICFSSDSGPI